MPSISRRSSELGTENAFVVLAEVLGPPRCQKPYRWRKL